ncbi:hypothetical protein NYR55_05370 [Sphingomonas sp. BGYR3]|uniref:hypothetical protein n=1 Tax=Sphingomonas sp. BGYR3 TaxID=2975483 RepID=UPI0021A2CAA2|nr:hypothetical protein [Sphingomonas sp. BGYR3]MDG5488050.1 hypothetical protein [Sphingomonas sp. BGYR3]
MAIVAGTAGSPLGFVLIKHDVAIALAVVPKLFRRIDDWLTVMVAVPLLALIARVAVGGLPSDRRSMLGVAITALIAAGVAKLLIERLRFHRADGVLAHEAQRLRARVGYAVSLTLGAFVMAIATLAVLGLFDENGILIGGCIGLSVGVLLPLVQAHGHRLRGRIASPGLHRFPRAWIAAAAVSVGVGVGSVFIPSSHDLNAIVIISYALGVLALTARVDAEVVRFMTLVGHGGLSLLRHWLSVQIALLWPLAILLMVAGSWPLAIAICLVSIAVPLVTALRILAYRALSPLVADWTVALVVGAAGYAGFTLPPLGGVIIAIAMLGLARRGANARWLLQ